MERQAEGLNNYSLEQLLHGGEHFDDIDQAMIRQMERLTRRDRTGNITLPCDILHDCVVELGLTWPTPI
jgi:hypothetical protein